MDAAENRHRRRVRRAVIATIVSSLLIHVVVITAALVWLLVERRAEQKDKRELVFLEQPPPKEPEKPVVEAPALPPAPRQAPSKRSKAPSAAPLAPSPEPASPADPQLGSPDAPVSDEPIATSPNPAPSAFPGLPPGMSPDQVRTNLSWNAFERAFEQTATAAREAYEAASMEKRRGGMRFGSLSGKVKAALENHRSWVAEGHPEQLEPREVQQFRAYLESTHEKIHALFADGFLVSLTSLDPSDPLNNMNLMTKMEFEILADGKINEVRVLKSSGIAVFDAAAVHSLYGASPFIPPPKEILSYNSRVYFRWGFYRNQRKCGVFNAEPYRLRAPDAAPEAIPEATKIFTAG
jgi:TonB family protein